MLVLGASSLGFQACGWVPDLNRGLQSKTSIDFRIETSVKAFQFWSGAAETALVLSCTHAFFLMWQFCDIVTNMLIIY